MQDDQELLGITSLWWMRVASPIFFFRGVGVEVEEVALGDTEARLAARSRGVGRLSGTRKGIHASALLRPAVSGAERIPDLTGRRTRRTIVLTTQLTDTALFPGGRAGVNLCGRTAVTTCKDTQLRLLHAPPVLLPEPVPYLGVDQFAVRRGRTYATILGDMNTHRPNDALADRTGTPPPPGCANTPRCGSSAATAPAKST
jgi:Transposase.